MVDSVSAKPSASPAPTASEGGRDVSTFSQLQRCKSQLGDWVACPSSKTPEGQKIIENLRSQISRLEQRQQSQTQGIKPQPSSVQSTGSPSQNTVSRYGVDAWA
jgi:hypothetical protein